MTGQEKFEMSSIDVSKALSSPPDAIGGPKNEAVTLMETQTCTRRLFSQAQLFAFSMVYLGVWFSTAM